MTVNIENSIINYKIINGDEKKPVLIFLHEGLGCIEMWKTFPEKLCRKTGCAALLYDRCGYGKSSVLAFEWNENYHNYYAFKELPGIINAVFPGREIILIGHSDGATISLIYSSSNPENLKAVILEAPHVFVEDATVEGVKDAVEAYKNGKLDKLYKYHGKKTDSIFSAWSGYWTDIRFRKWNIENILPDIKVPQLIIQGDKDRYGTEKQYNSIFNKTSANTELEVINDCGHSPHISRQQQTVIIMTEYIQKLF